MRRFGTGKNCLLPCLRTNYGQNDAAREGRPWYVDETAIKVQGKWCYLYRAIDHDGNLVDSLLSEKRDMDAAKQFFRQKMAVLPFLSRPACTGKGEGGYATRRARVHWATSKTALVGFSLVPHGEDDAHPHVGQGTHRHTMAFPLPAFAVVVVLGPGFLLSTLPGKLLQGVAQRLETIKALMHFGIRAA